jgi:hypothetical protein
MCGMRDSTGNERTQVFSAELITAMTVADSATLRDAIALRDTWRPGWNQPVQVPSSTLHLAPPPVRQRAGAERYT